MTRRILGMMCARNEADRYLTDCISWQLQFLDDVFVFDDRSDDDTAAVATACGAIVEVRDEFDQSFLQHEGKFRDAAWRQFELALQPMQGDWILAFDADEFFIACGDPWQVEREAICEMIDMARGASANAVMLPFAEIFGDCHINGPEGSGMEGTFPAIRVDGFWPTIEHPRLFAYQSGGHFANRVMGGGSVPTYVHDPIHSPERGPMFLHYGYYREEDRRSKYERYSNHSNNGHNSAHIESILQHPDIRPWFGRKPW